MVGANSTGAEEGAAPAPGRMIVGSSSGSLLLTGVPSPSVSVRAWLGRPGAALMEGSRGCGPVLIRTSVLLAPRQRQGNQKLQSSRKNYRAQCRHGHSLDQPPGPRHPLAIIVVTPWPVKLRETNESNKPLLNSRQRCQTCPHKSHRFVASWLLFSDSNN